MPIDDEGHAIEEVVDRLATKFPQIPRETVTEVVIAQHAQFGASAIRDFVPVLVEHGAAELLRLGERTTAD